MVVNSPSSRAEVIAVRCGGAAVMLLGGQPHLLRHALSVMRCASRCPYSYGDDRAI